MYHQRQILSLAIATSLMATSALATNGMFSHGYGTHSKGMAGAGVAYAGDSMAAATNPANMVTVGDRLDIGVALFRPLREYSASASPLGAAPGGPLQMPAGTFFVADGKTESGKRLFYIPHFGYNMMIDSQSAFGISVGGNGGMDTHYGYRQSATFVGDNPSTNGFDFAGKESFQPAPAKVSSDPCDANADRIDGSNDNAEPPELQTALEGFLPNQGFTVDSVADNGGQRVPGVFGNCKSAGIDLSQLFMGLTYSRKMGETNLGASLILAAQQIKAYGLSNFGAFVADGNPDDLTRNGYDYAYGMGARFGVTHTFADMLTLGASYQTKTYMTKFDDYSDLFANGGEFDIPASLTIGLAVTPVQGLTLALDIQKIYYSDIDAIANPNNLVGQIPGESCVMGDFSRCLGGSHGAGFGWRDLTTIKLGAEYWVNSSLALRAGYSRNNRQVIDKNQIEFNILAPATIREHFTAGFTFMLDKTNEISFAAMYAPEESVKGKNRFAGGQQDIKLTMKQYELEFNYAYKF